MRDHCFKFLRKKKFNRFPHYSVHYLEDFTIWKLFLHANPTLPRCGIPLVIQVLGTTAVPHFLTQHSVSAAGGLPEPYANETSSEALTAEARVGEWRGAEGSSKVTGLVEGWISWPKKMHGASLQQCFAAVKWSVLYFSEGRFYSVCRSRLKCTQVRWQISWCA